MNPIDEVSSKNWFKISHNPKIVNIWVEFFFLKILESFSLLRHFTRARTKYLLKIVTWTRRYLKAQVNVTSINDLFSASVLFFLNSSNFRWIFGVDFIGNFADDFWCVPVVCSICWTEIYEKPPTLWPQNMHPVLQLLSSRGMFVFYRWRFIPRIDTKVPLQVRIFWFPNWLSKAQHLRRNLAISWTKSFGISRNNFLCATKKIQSSFISSHFPSYWINFNDMALYSNARR
jgi:hypothetical protein